MLCGWGDYYFVMSLWSIVATCHFIILLF